MSKVWPDEGRPIAQAYGPMAAAFWKLDLWRRQEDGTPQVEVAALGPDGLCTKWQVPADQLQELARVLSPQVKSGMIRLSWAGKDEL